MTNEMDAAPATEDGNGALVKDSDAASFTDDVLNASQEVPIIVDLWAPWCGPCRTLSPIIEKAVTDARGAVKLVKINVDENQELAAQMRVQSIPAVYAFKDGKPVDGFVGALPESQVRDFIEKLAGEVGPTPADSMVEEAKIVRQSGGLTAAVGLFGQALKTEPGNIAALTGLAECYTEGGDLDLARQTLALVAPEHANDPAVLAAQASLILKEQAPADAADGGPEDLGALQAAVQANPGDQQARFDLASAYVAAERQAEAVDELLEMVGLHRDWDDQAARKKLVTLFDAFGPTDELTLSGRRRLSSLLFL